MPHIRRLQSGKYQVTERMPDGRRTRKTMTSLEDARACVDATEATAQLADRSRIATSWTADGLTIQIPDELLTMDRVAEVEAAIRRIVGEEA